MPLPLTLVEHKNEIKGAALNEGEVCGGSHGNEHAQ